MFLRSECPACEGRGEVEGEKFLPVFGASNCRRVDTWVRCQECVPDPVERERCGHIGCSALEDVRVTGGGLWDAPRCLTHRDDNARKAS